MCNMCGCGQEAFMGAELAPQSVYDVGATGVVSQPEMFNTDSLDTLGNVMELPITSAPQIGIN